MFLGVARGQYLIAEKLFKFSMVSTIIGSILNVLANYLLIPVYGGCGAAIATLVSYSTAAFFRSFFIKGPNSIMRQQISSLFVPLKVVK